jgi:hypothetical protein
LREDRDDLRTFKDRLGESTLSYEELVKTLKVRGKL